MMMHYTEEEEEDRGLMFGSGLTNGLDILAKIAANTLQTEFGPLDKSTDNEKETKPKRKRSSNRTRLVDVDQFQMEQITKMANQTLVRLFADSESDEMKKTYKFICQLLPGRCHFETQGFGSDVQAKTNMRKHLAGHVQEMKTNPEKFDHFVAESTQAKKRRLDHENLSNDKQKETETAENIMKFNDKVDFFNSNPVLREHDYLMATPVHSSNLKVELKCEEEDENQTSAVQSDQWVEAIQVAKTEDVLLAHHQQQSNPMVQLHDIGSEVVIDSEELEPVEVQKERERAKEAIEELQSRGSQGKDFQCKLCERKFTAYGTLLSHLRSHAGFKPYVCELCNAVFTRQHSLNYHVLLHKNETRFECAICKRKFRHPSHYKEHLRRHNEGGTTYYCDECNTEYRTRNTYKRHVRIMHGKTLSPAGELMSLNAEDMAKLTSEELKKEKTKMQKKKNKKFEFTPQLDLMDENSTSRHSYDEEVAKISQKFHATEAILNAKVIISQSESNDSFCPSTESEFSTPDPSEKPPNDSPNSLLEFGSSPPSHQIHSPKSLRMKSRQEQNRPVIHNKEKSPNLLENNYQSAFDLVKRDEEKEEEEEGGEVFQEILPPFKRGAKALNSSKVATTPLVAHLNGHQVFLIPKQNQQQDGYNKENSTSKLEQCLRYGSAALINQPIMARIVTTGNLNGSSQSHSIVTSSGVGNVGQTFLLSQPINLSSSAPISSIRLVPMVANKS